MPSLGSRLFSELSPKFFGLLGGPNARLYLDVLDGLEKEMSARGDAMERVEVLEIIDRILVPGIHLENELDDEQTAADTDSPSNKVLRRLVAVGWMEEERRPGLRRSGPTWWRESGSITQIMNLLNLPPWKQEELLFLDTRPGTGGCDGAGDAISFSGNYVAWVKSGEITPTPRTAVPLARARFSRLPPASRAGSRVCSGCVSPSP